MDIHEQVKRLPDSPGVYLMKDKMGQVIYVGKARSLRKRVRQYFQSSSGIGPRIQLMAENVNYIDYIITDSEVEALVLECNLIKKYSPRYNVLLKDDKTFPYIKVSLNEYFPRVYITRKVVKDGSKYFGPYTNVGAVRETLNTIRGIFPVRGCKRKLGSESTGERACLNYHINKCVGPCEAKVSKAEYDEMINDICIFLGGRYSKLINKLEKDMDVSARQLNFEKACMIRDRLSAIKRMSEAQRVVSTDFEDRDIIAFARNNVHICVQIFFVRSGITVGNEYFMLNDIIGSSDEEVLTSFIKQFYLKATFIPREILVSYTLDDTDVLATWLGEKKEGRVYLKNPKKGEKRKLLNLVQQNADNTLSRMLDRMEIEKDRTDTAVRELTEVLRLTDKVISRIEAFDISNIQGAQSVGSMVVFVDGMPVRKDYRRFRIKTVEGPDDFASMEEVVYRRYKSDIPVPDLIMVDGGKGQLSAALRALKELDKENLPIIGLAKENEEIFSPNNDKPLILPKRSKALHLIQRIRDEAHRFAITYHRSLRNKDAFRSVLDDITGIGDKRKKTLIRHFGSLENIIKAELIELEAVKDIDKRTARNIFEYFKT